MKKLYPILLMLAVMLGSCSGDDSSNEVQNTNPDPVPPVVTDSTAIDTTNTPAVSIKISKIEVSSPSNNQFNSIINFVYDGDKIISEHAIGPGQEDSKIEYIYNGDKIDHINLYDLGILRVVYNVTYTGNNITQIQKNSGNNISIWNYDYNQNNQLSEHNMYFNDILEHNSNFEWDYNGNIINIGNQQSGASIEYDDKINPLKNCRLLYPKFFIFDLSNNNIKKIIYQGSNTVRIFEYEYNEHGYPTWSHRYDLLTDTELIYKYYYAED